MILVTRFNGSEFFLNGALVESVESTPDTVITLVNGKKFVVRESVAEILQRIMDFYAKIGLVAVQAKQPLEAMKDEK